MRLSIFRENDNVLLVGEGNFSFALSLVKHNLPIAITASCYENFVSNECARKNLEILETHDIRVLLGVDGTKLGEHSILHNENFDKIIFNFPHVGGKMRLDKNRELLRGFFVEAEKLLKPDGTILMTLCNGQGGTLADEPRRRWDDSWKVTEMAAHGNFVLKSVEPFEAESFWDYTSTGYRGLDKEFNMQKSLTHLFKKAPLWSRNLAPKTKINNATRIQREMKYRDAIPDSSRDSDFLCSPVFIFDVTFTIGPDFKASDLYTVVYNFVGRIVRDVEFVRSYEFPDTQRVTETYRISYRSDDIPLHRQRIVDIHKNVVAKLLEENLHIIVTR